jgi:hypothetical protein
MPMGELTSFDTHVTKGIQKGRFANIGHANDENIQFKGMGKLLGDICVVERGSNHQCAEAGRYDEDLLTRISFKILMSFGRCHEVKSIC